MAKRKIKTAGGGKASGADKDDRKSNDLAVSLMSEADLLLAQGQEITQESKRQVDELNRAKMAHTASLMREADLLLGESKNTFDTMTEFAKEAARNMQDALGQFFFDAVAGDLDLVPGRQFGMR